MNGITNHAFKRCQQRGIPPLVVEWLLEFGHEKYDSGAEIIHFDRQSRKAVRRHVGRQIMSKLEGYLDSYLILKDGHVLTVGHRYKRIHNN